MSASIDSAEPPSPPPDGVRLDRARRSPGEEPKAKAKGNLRHSNRCMIKINLRLIALPV